MKRFVMTLILALALPSVWTGVASADNRASKAQQTADAIMADDSYIYGNGVGNDRQEAMQSALADMIGKISVNIASSSSYTADETMHGDGSIDSNNRMSMVIKSYSAPANLEGVESVWLSDKAPDFRVMTYLKRSQVEKMFERRRDNVANLVREGIRAEEGGKIDLALRYLYHAYAILGSLPDARSLTVDIDGTPRLLSAWIPEQMRDICAGVRFGIAEVSKPDDAGGRTVSIMAHYKDEPVTSIGFSYWRGPQGQSPVLTARDGMSEIEVGPATPLDPLALDIEYRFPDENHLVPEFEPLLDSFNGAGLVPNAHVTLAKSAKALKSDKQETKAFKEAVSAGADEGISVTSKEESAPCVGAMEKIVYAIVNKKYDGIKELFTDEGYSMFESLIHYGNARILGKATRDTYGFYPMKDRTVCRSIPMQFSFEGGKRKFTEDVTFTFNSDGLIESLAFGLGSVARKDIFSMQGEAWSDYMKMVVVTFLENYRTAFALKRLDFIETMFDDDAVIIVGHVVKKAEKRRVGDAEIIENKEHVTYARKSKAEYLAQLKRCFASNQFVNIRFANTEVGAVDVGEDTYGIQLRQEYFSSSYGDVGYLYLMVDFLNPDEPIIKVRTWQPERKPDLTPNLPKDSPYSGIFSNGYFG
ncbi:MAG: LPP20 family lipoprotein [Muribaculaceae bacterium]|nr:LPP20 family lipoprotein [Muribaculaceae bacterium]